MLPYCSFLQDDKVVGWCNANDKQAYGCDVWLDESDAGRKIKSIVCFNIAPAMRRQGIASMLLKKVCDDAKAENYDYVEVYPFNCPDGESRDYHGPFGMYEKQGFVVHKKLEHTSVCRKYFTTAIP